MEHEPVYMDWAMEKDNMVASVYGVGFTGIDRASTRYPKAYYAWKDMLKRGYSTAYLDKNPSYKGVTVAEVWHDFRNFKKWYDANYRDGYALDKDLLVQGNKVYSPTTCIYISVQLNNLIHSGSGVHYNKSAKRYTAQLQVDGRKQHLGYYDTEKEASTAYRLAKYNYLITLAGSKKYNKLISSKLVVLANKFKD